MKSLRKIGVLVGILGTILMLPGNLFAADFYIAQSAAGSANGTSCSNAYAYTWFNTSGNWTSSSGSTTQIGPGNTVHLCGIISNPLAAQGSGSSGNPITIRFESGAKLSSPSWNGIALNLSGVSHVVADGNPSGVTTPCGWVNGAQVSCNGIIENTLNGTPGGACPGGTCSHQDNAQGIYMDLCNNCEVRNLTIQNIYVMTSPTDTTATGVGIGRIDGSNIYVHNLNISNVYQGHENYVNSGDTNLVFANIDVSHCNWGLNTSNHTGTVSYVYYINNHIHDLNTYDTTDGHYHHDGLFISMDDVGTLDHLYIYNNVFGGDWGANCTSPIYMNEPDQGKITNAYVFNNVFYNNHSGPYSWANGICVQSGNSTTTSGGNSTGNGPIAIYNNTVICESAGDPGMISSGNGIDFRNNLQQGCVQFFGTGGGLSSVLTEMDYNYYANPVGGSGSNSFGFLGYSVGAGSGTFASQFAAWKTIVQGTDVNPTANSTNETHSGIQTGAITQLSSTGVPSAGSPTIGAGQNLTTAGVSLSIGSNSLCTESGGPWPCCTGAGTGSCPYNPLAYDIAGNARPSSGAWDIGAYQSTAGALTAPTGLRLMSGN
ncbi:MAG: hypothetical protein ACLP3B_10650 [Syntrophobacteraceae bacterium]